MIHSVRVSHALITSITITPHFTFLTVSYHLYLSSSVCYARSVSYPVNINKKWIEMFYMIREASDMRVRQRLWPDGSSHRWTICQEIAKGPRNHKEISQVNRDEGIELWSEWYPIFTQFPEHQFTHIIVPSAFVPQAPYMKGTVSTTGREGDRKRRSMEGTRITPHSSCRFVLHCPQLLDNEWPS